MNSSYFVLASLLFTDASGDRDDDDTQAGDLRVFGNTSHGAIRNTTLTGNRRRGGLGFGRGVVTQFVVWNNHIHHNGDLQAADDQDRHGITIGGGGDKSHIWIVDNELSHNSGDGLQVNGGRSSMRLVAGAQESSTHHIYVGRNTSHHNRQTGFWTKQAQDVIFSENIAYAHRRSASASGACLGYQYGPTRVWFLFNRLRDCEYGVQGQSDSLLGFTSKTEIYVVGNVFERIAPSGTFTSHAAMMFRGGTAVERVIVNNTIVDAVQGINTTNARQGTLDITNNLFAYTARLPLDGATISVTDGTLARSAVLSSNVFYGKLRIILGRQRWESAEEINSGESRGNRSERIAFGAAAGGDFTPLSGSAAVDRGSVHPVYELFERAYGLSIKRDVMGRPRPQRRGWDVGAFELPADRTEFGSRLTPVR